MVMVITLKVEKLSPLGVLVHELEQVVAVDVPPPVHRLLQHVHVRELTKGNLQKTKQKIITTFLW